MPTTYCKNRGFSTTALLTLEEEWLCCGVCPGHHNVLSVIPGLNPLDADSSPRCNNQKCLQTLPNDPRETKVLAENHNVKTKIAVSAITIIIFVITGNWEIAYSMHSIDSVKSSQRGKNNNNNTWDPEKSKNRTYPYNDPFRDVGRQQVELVLVSSIQSNHQHEVSSSETADQCQHIRKQET